MHIKKAVVRLLTEIEEVQNLTSTPLLCPGRLQQLRIQTNYIKGLWEGDLRGFSERQSNFLRTFPPHKRPSKEEREEQRQARFIPLHSVG